MTRLTSVHRISTGPDRIATTSGRPVLGDNEIKEVDSYGGPGSGHFKHKSTIGSMGGSQPASAGLTTRTGIQSNVSWSRAKKETGASEAAINSVVERDERGEKLSAKEKKILKSLRYGL